MSCWTASKTNLNSLGWDEFDDDEIEIVQKICTRWGEHWTKDFPHLNITPKAHDLIFVIPEFKGGQEHSMCSTSLKREVKVFTQISTPSNEKYGASVNLNSVSGSSLRG